MPRETAYRLARAEQLPRYGSPDLPLKVTFARFEANAHGYYREITPGLKLREYGLADVRLSDEGDLNDRVNWSNVFVVSRPNAPWEVESLHDLRESGRAICLDTDDLPELLWTVSDDLRRIWTAEKLNDFEACVRIADVVTVSTPPLAQAMSDLGARQVITLDNCLDPRSGRWNIPWPEDDGKIRLGWSSGFTHSVDASVLERPVKEILSRYPQTVFRSVGYMPHWVADLDPEQLEVIPTAEVLDYPRALVGIDIALGPLASTPFNDTRSSVKAWEVTCAGSVFVASRYGPYQRDLVDGQTAILCETDDEWITALSRLVQESDLRERIWWGAFKAMWRRSIDWMVPAYYWAYRAALLSALERMSARPRLWAPA